MRSGADWSGLEWSGLEWSGLETGKIKLSRQSSEHALHEQREWFRVTLSSIGDAVILVKPVPYEQVLQILATVGLSKQEGQIIPSSSG